MPNIRNKNWQECSPRIQTDRIRFFGSVMKLEPNKVLDQKDFFVYYVYDMQKEDIQARDAGMEETWEFY